MCVSRIWDHMQPEDHTAHDVARHCRRHGRREEALAAAGDEVELAHVLRREGGRRERLSSVFICASVCARACARERVVAVVACGVPVCLESASSRLLELAVHVRRQIAFAPLGVERAPTGHVQETSGACRGSGCRPLGRAPEGPEQLQRAGALRRHPLRLRVARGAGRGGGFAPDPEPKGDGG